MREGRSRPMGEHSFLQGQLIRVKHRRAVRKAERKHLWDARRVAPRQRPPKKSQKRGAGIGAPGVLGVARSPWLFLGLLMISLALLILPAAGMSGIAFSQSRPAFPATSDMDQALYALLVPEPAAKQESGVNPVLLTSLKVTSYATRAGDTISTIASRFKLNVDTVVSWNGVRDARAIRVGTLLAIPNANGLKYAVRRGDTLQGIALSSGVTLNDILDWNRLSSSVISVGQELFLPGARMRPNDLNRILGNLFMYPVWGRISSYFGERSDPFTGTERMHNGIDIVGKPLTAIAAAMAGTVADVGFNYNYGNYVILKHTGFYQTLYGHLTRYSVKRGEKVQQGQTVGELGSTGYSTGPHLHFSIFHNGEAVDPLRFLK
jgi:murein DD-endopeptidase MepM/ murein hydrolase activator NlpD